MEDASPLDTLRQLKEWLDAGTITPQEFEALKKKLLFNDPAPPHPLPSAPAPAANSEAAVPPPPAPAAAPIDEPAPPYSNEPPPAAFAEEDALVPPPAKSNALTTILIVGGILALLAVVVYLATGTRPSERLTSVSKTAADTVAVQPEVGPQAEQLELPPVAAPETVRVVPAAPPVAVPADSGSAAPPAASPAAPVATVPAPTPAPTPTPAPADENAVRTRVLQALTAYYDDLKTAPFDAAQHFAPAVERFYTLQNTTPAAINDDLTKSHFPEFTEEETQVVPGSLKIGPETEDGTRLVTYQERSRAFRASRQQHQQTTAQVRARLNRDYQLTYLRQERLLENTFSE